jgi:hypothetical protein
MQFIPERLEFGYHGWGQVNVLGRKIQGHPAEIAMAGATTALSDINKDVHTPLRWIETLGFRGQIPVNG